MRISTLKSSAPAAGAAPLPSESSALVTDDAVVSVVVTGHVDHGKSTVVGRLLADTGALPEGRLEQIRAFCERHSRPFEHAYLLDALKDERAQGITIDAARVFFTAGGRRYVLIDAPGHVEFVKNMVTGASRADAALIVIDGDEGVRENSRRHGYLLGVLGIREIIVLVNKMDLVQYSQAAFENVVREYAAFLNDVGLQPRAFIPVAARHGDSIVTRGAQLDWYAGPTVLECLAALTPRRTAADAPFRMPVQAVYKFTAKQDSRRIIAGTIETGTLSVGDRVVFQPSGKEATVKTLEAFNREAPASASAGEATGFTLAEPVYVARGQVVTRAGEAQPLSARRFKANLFWLGRRPLVSTRDYTLKIGCARVAARVTIEHVLDASSLQRVAVKGGPATLERLQVAECVIDLARHVAVDVESDLEAMHRFVLVDDYEIAGGGIVREVLAAQAGTRPGARARTPQAARRTVDTGRTIALMWAIETARRAGAVVMRHFRQPLVVDRTVSAMRPTTNADLEAHDLITAALSNFDPRIPIVSEEGHIPDYAVRRRYERFWLIDPLDGTKEFIAGIPEFTVNIALIERGEPVIGVVVSPADDTTYFAAPHLGAWRQTGTAPAKRLRSAAAGVRTPLRVVESRFHTDPRLDAVLTLAPVTSRTQLGSSLKICRLAEGDADLYARLIPIMEWDVAAADCVFRCSGRGHQRWSPFTYNGPELRFDRFVLGADELPALREAMS